MRKSYKKPEKNVNNFIKTEKTFEINKIICTLYLHLRYEISKSTELGITKPFITPAPDFTKNQQKKHVVLIAINITLY